jgi:hypothetical protein
MIQDFLSVFRTKSLFSSVIPLNFGSCLSSMLSHCTRGVLFHPCYSTVQYSGRMFFPSLLSVSRWGVHSFSSSFIWQVLFHPEQYTSAGGESFFIVDSSQEEQSSLSSYVDLVDSFREIHRRTWPNSPALVSVLCFLYLFVGLECVGRSFGYVAHFVFFERCLDSNPGLLPT